MGNGRLLTGIGYGDATVFNPNQAIQNFGNIIAQQKAEQAAKDKAIVDQMAKLKPDGIREADTDDYKKYYEDWKNTAIAARQLPRNSKQRLEQAAAAQAKYNELGAFINKSKEQKAHENSLGNMLLSNPHLFSDDAHQKVLKSFTSPMTKTDFISHDKYTTLERYIDGAKIEEGFNKLKDTLLKAEEWSNPIQSAGKDKQGNKTGVVVYNERAVAPEKLLSTYAHAYDIDKNVKAFVDKKYSDLVADNPAQTKMLRLKKLAVDRGELKEGKNGELVTEVIEKTKPTFKPDYKPFDWDTYVRKFNFTQANGGNNQLTPAQMLMVGDPNKKDSGMIRGDMDSGNRFIQLAPKAQYGGKTPSFEVNDVTGEHILKFPAQLVKDPTAVKKNQETREYYEKHIEKKGGILGFGGTKVPFEKSKMAAEIVPEYKVSKPAMTYKLDPNNPQDYVGQLTSIAAEQGIKLPAMNQAIGKKGGRGVIEPIIKAEKASKKKTVKLKIPKGRLF